MLRTETRSFISIGTFPGLGIRTAAVNAGWVSGDTIPFQYEGRVPTQHVAVYSGLDSVMYNGVGVQKDLYRWLSIRRSHHGPLSAIPTAQGGPCHS